MHQLRWLHIFFFPLICWCCYSLSCIQLSEISRTVTCQAPLSMGFPRQEYWSGLSFFFQKIFPTQGSKLHLLPGRQILYHWSTWEVQFLILWSILINIMILSKSYISEVNPVYSILRHNQFGLLILHLWSFAYISVGVIYKFSLHVLSSDSEIDLVLTSYKSLGSSFSFFYSEAICKTHILFVPW